MSWLWQDTVEGPRRSELAGVRWNTAALATGVQRESPVMALVSTPQDDRGSAVLSFPALPVGRNLRIEVSKRRRSRPSTCCRR
jgi:hypothetical protein